MKKIIKRFLVITVFISMIVTFNYNLICFGVQFNPQGQTQDDEEYKEYTASILDLQINTVMALSLDEVANLDNNLSLVGSIKINKKVDNEKIEYLTTLPEVSLVDEDNNVVCIAEVIPQSEYSMTQSDIYYINLYNLEVQQGKTYRLIATITDNDNNIITKEVTYFDQLVLSQGTEYNMTYQSVNNILNISFIKNNILSTDTQDLIINGINITQKEQYASNCLSQFLNTYSTSYNQMDFDKVKVELDKLLNSHISNYFASINEDLSNYIISTDFDSIHKINIEIRYKLNDEGTFTRELANKEINVEYKNDGFLKSQTIQDAIDNALSNYSNAFGIEVELNDNYDYNINSYDYVKNTLKIANSSIVVKEFYSQTAGLLNKYRVISAVLGTESDVYIDDCNLILSFNPVVSIPNLYNTNDERLNYAKEVIQKYIDNHLNDITISSISYIDNNTLEVVLQTESSTSSMTMTEKVILKDVDYIKGDLDRNGAVNSDDAAIALDLYRYGNVSDEDLQIGDMDENGLINSDDAALILDVYRYGI